MTGSLNSLAATVRFLSRIPVPGLASQRDHLAIQSGLFPLVGLLLGLVSVLADLAFSALPWHLRNALLVTFMVGLTGALHLDALMDAADGLSAPRGQALEAMHASVHSAPGIAVGTLALMLWWLGLGWLDGDRRALWLACTPMLGRSAILLGYLLVRPYPEAGNVTRILSASAHGGRSVGALLAAVAIAGAALGAPGLISLAVGGGISLAAIALMRSKTPTWTGDQFGALGVIAEVAVLLTAGSLSDRAALS